MVPSDYVNFYNTLINLVQQGDVSVERINDAVRRILRIKFIQGLFENAYPNVSLQDSLGTAAHRAVGREAVRKSIVLLKKKDGILPLTKDNIKIEVAGVHANNLGYQCGGWTIYWQGGSGDITNGTTILEAIQQAAPGADINYSESGVISDTTADVAIVVIGETPYAEGNGDSDDLNLPQASISMVKRIKESGLPVIVILISGRPLIIEPIIPYSDAIFAAWLPGTEGRGITDILFGDYNPTGILSHSWPRKMDDIPINYGDENYDPLFEYDFGITTLENSTLGSAPKVYAAVITSSEELNISFNKKMLQPVNAESDFIISLNSTSDISIDSVRIHPKDSTAFVVYFSNTIVPEDIITLSYSGESVFSYDSGQLMPFSMLNVYNGLTDQSDIFTLPGRIEAENYYNMSGIQTENTTDTGGGLNVGYIDTGDWMSYLINVPVSSYYKITSRIASQSTGGVIHFKVDSDVFVNVDVPITGDWQNWTNAVTFVYLDEGIYEFQLYAEEGGFNVNWIDFEIITSIDPVDAHIYSYELHQNFPNPFNPNTTITYDLPEYSHVSISLFNMLGQEVEEIINQSQQAGRYSIQFDGSNLPSGIYYYRLNAGKYVSVKKMLLLK
jgi:beta-glucosidase